MKLIIDGYNKTLRKKDNQIVVMEKDKEIYRISANKVSDITIMAKGHITFDALNLMARNNIKLISINYFGQINYILESPNQENVNLKKIQYQASENYKGLLISKEFIKSKMKNQKSTIKTLNKNKKLKEVKIIENKIKQNIKDFENFKITPSDDVFTSKNKKIVDKTVFKLINTNQINETNIDKRNNSLKLESRKLLAGEIMAKIHSDLTFENEKVTYANIIENQTKKLVKSLLNNNDYTGFYLNW